MGEDKSLLTINGHTFTEHAYKTISPLIQSCIVSSNNPGNNISDCIRVPDLYENIGPMGGIYSSLLNSGFEENLVISCDTPFIGTEVYQQLISEKRNADIIIAKHNTKVNPLIGIYSKSVLPVLKQQIDKKNFKIFSMLELTNYRTADVSSVKNTNFVNINTQEIYRAVIHHKKTY